MEKQNFKNPQGDQKHSGKENDPKHPDRNKDQDQFKKSNDPKHSGKDNDEKKGEHNKHH
jgi:hypothetical protein